MVIPNSPPVTEFIEDLPISEWWCGEWENEEPDFEVERAWNESVRKLMGRSQLLPQDTSGNLSNKGV